MTTSLDLQTLKTSMNRDEISQILKANIDKVVRVTFTNGILRLVTVINLDDEGFINKLEDNFFWAAFEDISEIEKIESQ